jgi:hypothetical protein
MPLPLWLAAVGMVVGKIVVTILTCRLLLPFVLVVVVAVDARKNRQTLALILVTVLRTSTNQIRLAMEVASLFHSLLLFLVMQVETI